MPPTVASLHVYPIKSLGGFAVSEAHIGDRGFVHDRRWMLVMGHDEFITQREVPAMACLHCAPHDEGFRVTDIRGGGSIHLPWTISGGEERRATIWSDTVHVLPAPTEVSTWFAQHLGVPCRLVFMPDSAQRPVNPTYAVGITSLSDGYPYLILSQASLDDLNARLDTPLPMERFRPNIVITGGDAYQEDAWKEIAIGHARFSLVKPCMRCVIPNTDQRTAERSKEPLRTLATYRTHNNGVRFGMNAMALDGDVLSLGDRVSI
ncbi:MAG: MOSC N-terminal beta barrel domain-containing protein [Flavobacteriales bacterium]